MPKVTIEKMIYGGDGLGRLRPVPSSPGESSSPNSRASERGKAVFVPFVLEGEVIDVEIVEQHPGFARGKAVSLLSPRLSALSRGVRISAAAAAASISTPAMSTNWQ